MVTIVGLNLRSGRSWEVVRTTEPEARAYIDALRVERARARDLRTGAYPATIHGIRRDPAPVNPQ